MSPGHPLLSKKAQLWKKQVAFFLLVTTWPPWFFFSDKSGFFTSLLNFMRICSSGTRSVFRWCVYRSKEQNLSVEKENGCIVRCAETCFYYMDCKDLLTAKFSAYNFRHILRFYYFYWFPVMVDN
ncbi:hypothetical protein CEXT_608131 [Caerostris extrusa]|uniref:Uncharacterized protein n=1 Tax=Caerostris extrusa TaxID=172846 RepID=A0AAV4RBL6_CAEEX|nr:hypothetical protein CEXT_608131 [Caerostris extrusa]